MKVCSVQGCDQKHHGHGWCRLHYVRWKNYGDPHFNKWDPDVRFRDKTEKRGDCIVWTGYIGPKGYAAFRNGGKPQLVHRFSYERHFGAIPQGMQVDHTCHNRACVQPLHLRLASNKQNSENITGATARSASGVRGVTASGKNGRWRASVGHRGRQVHVGMFANLADAEAAVIAKRNELFTHNDADRTLHAA